VETKQEINPFFTHTALQHESCWVSLHRPQSLLYIITF